MSFKIIFTALISISMIFSFTFESISLGSQDEGHMTGMATFLDSDIDHVYFPGDTISFKIGPFKCQAGNLDKVVFGIFDKDINTFDGSKPVFSGLSLGEFYDKDYQSVKNLYYAPLVADEEGYFTFTGTIPATTELKDGLIGITVYSNEGNPIASKSLNLDAKMPIVDASNTAAVFINLAKKMDPSNVDKSKNPFVLSDDDIDHVYFDGDIIKVLVRSLMPSMPTMPGAPTSFKTRLVTGYYDANGIFISKKIFKDSQMATFEGIGSAYYVEVDIPADGTQITAIIENPGNPFSPGAIAFIPFIQMSPGSEFTSKFTGGLAIPIMDENNVPAIFGIGIPDKSITCSPKLSKIKNLYNVENTLTFTKDGVGSIIFKPGLSILGSKNQFQSSSTNFNGNGLETVNGDISKIGDSVNVSIQNEAYSFNVDTDSINFLKNNAAGLVLLNAKKNLALPNLTTKNSNEILSISASDSNNMQIGDINSIVDINSIYYDEITDILTIPVKHFTTFRISKKELNTIDDNILKEYISNYKKISDLKINFDHQFTVKFNKAIHSDSLNSVKIINYTDNIYVPASINFSDDTKKTIKIIPSNPLDPQKQYMIVVESSCKDELGKYIKTGYYIMVEVY